MNFTKDISRRGFMRIFGAAGVTAAALPVIGQAQTTQAPAAGQQRRRGMGGGAGSDFGDTRVRDANAVIISSEREPVRAGGLRPRSHPAVFRSRRTRYHQESKMEAVKAFSETFDLKPGYVSMYPGSGNAVDLALYSNIGPDKPLVVADPSYEQGPRAADVMKAKLFSTPLTKDGRHDVKAMVAATPKAGAYYIVNPNNPTGTMTPKEDLVWLLKNKAPGSIVVVDEAYFHFSTPMTR